MGDSECPLSWSPDSTKLVYRFAIAKKAGDDPRNGMYCVDVDAGKIERLTKGVGGMPAWQPKVNEFK